MPAAGTTRMLTTPSVRTLSLQAFGRFEQAGEGRQIGRVRPHEPVVEVLVHGFRTVPRRYIARAIIGTMPSPATAAPATSSSRAAAGGWSTARSSWQPTAPRSRRGPGAGFPHRRPLVPGLDVSRPSLRAEGAAGVRPAAGLEGRGLIRPRTGVRRLARSHAEAPRRPRLLRERS
jgi:hypothetical protein